MNVKLEFTVSFSRVCKMIMFFVGNFAQLSETFYLIAQYEH